MNELVHYPVVDFGPAMKGMVIGGVGIIHVFLAQFAIGGGMLLCYFERLRQTGRCTQAGDFVAGYFKALVVISFVAGAVTGVGMWFTTIQVSPRTIGLMVDEFHWLWAIEWTFFALEVAAGYTFYRCGERLSDRLRMRLLVVYSVAAWGSLFWINGILSWQLTPGEWTPGATWVGFFNPSFWPSLLYRTVVCLTLASLVACLVVNAMSSFTREDRQAVFRYLGKLLLPMLAMPLIGIWYIAVIPDDSRGWILGGSPAMTMFLGISVGASVLIGAYAVLGLVRAKLNVNAGTAALLLALAFGATAGGEFVREGARKPFTVRDTLYANSIAESEIKRLRMVGSTTGDRYPMRNAAQYPTAHIELGAKVFRVQCSVCHTIRGANGVVHLAGGWSREQLRLNIAKLQHTKPFMPPFAGTARELDSVTALIKWESSDRKDLPTTADSVVLAKIQVWLDEAGTRPGGR